MSEFDSKQNKVAQMICDEPTNPSQDKTYEKIIDFPHKFESSHSSRILCSIIVEENLYESNFTAQVNIWSPDNSTKPAFTLSSGNYQIRSYGIQACRNIANNLQN